MGHIWWYTPDQSSNQFRTVRRVQRLHAIVISSKSGHLNPIKVIIERCSCAINKHEHFDFTLTGWKKPNRPLKINSNQFPGFMWCHCLFSEQIIEMEHRHAHEEKKRKAKKWQSVCVWYKATNYHPLWKHFTCCVRACVSMRGVYSYLAQQLLLLPTDRK